MFIVNQKRTKVHKYNNNIKIVNFELDGKDLYDVVIQDKRYKDHIIATYEKMISAKVELMRITHSSYMQCDGFVYVVSQNEFIEL